MSLAVRMALPNSGMSRIISSHGNIGCLPDRIIMRRLGEIARGPPAYPPRRHDDLQAHIVPVEVAAHERVAAVDPAGRLPLEDHLEALLVAADRGIDRIGRFGIALDQYGRRVC